MPLNLLQRLLWPAHRDAGPTDAAKPEAPAVKSLAEISALVDQHDMAEAEAACRDALAVRPQDAELLAMLGYIAQQTQRHELAVVTCAQAIRLQPRHWTAQFVSGLSFAALGQHRQAAAAFERAHRIAPTNGQSARHAIEQAAKCSDVATMNRVYGGYSAATKNDSASIDGSVLRSYAAALFRNSDFARMADVLAESAAKLERRPLRAVPDWARQHGSAVLRAGAVETIAVSAPATLGAAGLQPAGPTMTVTGNQPYVGELRDVTIFAKSSVILTADGNALNDNAVHAELGRFVSIESDPLVVARNGDELLLDPSSYRLEDHAGGVFLSGFVSEAFGHWVPEFLPKLQFLEQHPDFAGMPILVDHDMPASHIEYLACLVDNPVLRVPPGVGFRCKRLLVAPTAAVYTTEIPVGAVQHKLSPLSPRGLRFLRDRVLGKITDGSRFAKRVYLSRRGMTWRRLENGAETAAWLEDNGFQTVAIEELDFADQVRLFRDADCIVAPNGSSLLNAIFARPEVTLIVLSQPNIYNWGGFYGPMRTLGYDPLFVLGDVATDYKHADYRVPLARLQEALHRTLA